jgi:hypothetical protein
VRHTHNADDEMDEEPMLDCVEALDAVDHSSYDR